MASSLSTCTPRRRCAVTTGGLWLMVQPSAVYRLNTHDPPLEREWRERLFTGGAVLSELLGNSSGIAASNQAGSWLSAGLAVSRRYLRVPHAPLHFSGSRREICLISCTAPAGPGICATSHLIRGGGCRLVSARLEIFCPALGSRTMGDWVTVS